MLVHMAQRETSGSKRTPSCIFDVAVGKEGETCGSAFGWFEGFGLKIVLCVLLSCCCPGVLDSKWLKAAQ